jgi:hypothetical protein
MDLRAETPWLENTPTPSEPEKLKPTRAVAADLMSPTPHDRRSGTVKIEAMTSGQNPNIEVSSPSPSRAYSDSQLSLHPASKEPPLIVDLISSTPPPAKAQKLRLSISPGSQPPARQRSADRPSDQHTVSNLYSNPGAPDYNPLSLLGELWNLITLFKQDQCHALKIRPIPFVSKHRMSLLTFLQQQMRQNSFPTPKIHPRKPFLKKRICRQLGRCCNSPKTMLRWPIPIRSSSQIQSQRRRLQITLRVQ